MTKNQLLGAGEFNDTFTWKVILHSDVKSSFVQLEVFSTQFGMVSGGFSVPYVRQGANLACYLGRAPNFPDRLLLIVNSSISRATVKYATGELGDIPLFEHNLLPRLKFGVLLNYERIGISNLQIFNEMLIETQIII